jgi:hypothetical protein
VKYVWKQVSGPLVKCLCNGNGMPSDWSDNKVPYLDIFPFDVFSGDVRKFSLIVIDDQGIESNSDFVTITAQ